MTCPDDGINHNLVVRMYTNKVTVSYIPGVRSEFMKERPDAPRRFTPSYRTFAPTGLHSSRPQEPGADGPGYGLSSLRGWLPTAVELLRLDGFSTHILRC